jgi:hypothetical protein
MMLFISHKFHLFYFFANQERFHFGLQFLKFIFLNEFTQFTFMQQTYFITGLGQCREYVRRKNDGFV